MSNQIIGNIGLYFVCYRLSQLGWLAMTTSRNTRGIDVVAYEETGTKFVGLQVKTVSDRNAVSLRNGGIFLGDFWLVVNIVHDSIAVYVLTPKEVEGRLTRNNDGSPIRASLAPRSTPQRRGLETPRCVAPQSQRPALTPSRHGANGEPWAGTKKRA